MTWLELYALKAHVFHYINVVVLYNLSRQTVLIAIAHIKGLSYQSDYDVNMRMECLNNWDHKKIMNENVLLYN